MLPWEDIQAGLEAFLGLVDGDPDVKAEFVRSRAEFFRDEAGALAPGAELRHLEWFLLERPSASLGGIPAQVWQETWRERFADASPDLATAYLQSLPGAFEVTSVVDSKGLWLRDLFTLGELPVVEPGAVHSLAAGDLVVGRLFPAGEEVFLLSSTMAVYRDPALLSAVRADLERMRRVRRGVLRVQQLELEHLFHGPGMAPASQPPLSEVRARVRGELVQLGLGESAADGVLERIRAAARTANATEVTEILNRLAFDTGIDLTAARLALIEVWSAERGASARAATDDEGRDPASALAAFDLGRAQGKDLEQLFDELERALDVAEEEPEEDDAAPDFPGVVGAIVAEFLWEVEREHGPERAARWSCLEALGTYGREIGVLEELGRTHLLDFSARWILDESGLKDRGEVESLLAALQAFCSWCEEQQDLPLRSAFGETLEELQSSVPRHLALRATLRAGSGSGAYRVVHSDGRRARLQDRDGTESFVTLLEEQAAHLRDGDLVRLASRAGAPTLGASYPEALADWLFAQAPEARR